MPARILIVDDDPLMRKSLAQLLRREGYEIDEAADGPEALRRLDSEVIDLVITDLHMEPMSGLDFLKAMKPRHADVEAIVVTAFGSIEAAVQAMKLKAFDFVTKPFEPEEILQRVRNALEKSRLRGEVLRLRTEAQNAFGIEGIIGRSETLRPILSALPRVAQTNSTVLITGESGTGKELVARAIVQASRRAQSPFISVNCAAMPEALLEVELFGSVKGIFTDATTRKGLLEEASGGTFFLDEIGEAPLTTQAKLLRVLEEGSIRRLGDNRIIPIDVRFVAATNQSLEELVKNRRFREDLYFRLNVVRLKLPPLRERIEDIPLLIAHFLDRYSHTMNKPVTGITPDARSLMMAHSWPGNVRELANLMERMIAMTTNEVLDVNDLPDEIRVKTNEGGDFREDKKFIMGAIERSRIAEALAAHSWNVTRTARFLKMSRATLQNKMKIYELRAPAR